MATVSTPATLSSVKTVFGGGTPPNNLRSYLRGGSYVLPLSNAYPNIVSTGTLQLSGFAGTINPPAAIIGDKTAQRYTVAVSATATLSVGASNVQTTLVGGGVSNSAWRFAAHQADYEIQLQKVSGDTPTGSSVNTWLSLVSTRSWSLTTSPGGGLNFGGYLKLRLSASPFTELSNVNAVIDVFAEP